MLSNRRTVFQGLKPYVFLLILISSMIFSCATPGIISSVQEPDTDFLDQEALETQLLSQDALDPEVAILLQNFIEVLDGRELTISEDGDLFLLISTAHPGVQILSELVDGDISVFGLRLGLSLYQELGDQTLDLILQGFLLPSRLSGSRDTGWLWQISPEENSGLGIFPDQRVSLSLNLYLPGNSVAQKTIEHQGILFDVSLEWEIIPIIFPQQFTSMSFNQLPQELFSDDPIAIVLFPHLYGYEFLRSEDLSQGALRLYDPEDQGFLELMLNLGGAFQFRRRSEQGFFLTPRDPSSWFPISSKKTQEKGFGTTLPTRARILPTTVFRSAQVLGAESYELLSGGEILFQTNLPSIQRSREPVFMLPGTSSLVFTALRGSRPLIEVSFDLALAPTLPRTLSVNSPGFIGQVMEFPLTNLEFLPLVQHMINLGHAELRPSGSLAGTNLVDTQSGIPLLGIGSLDFGNQFGLELVSGNLGIRPERENHPLVGLSWIGAGRVAWVMSILAGMEDRVLPPRVTGLIDDRSGVWRLALQDEWQSFSQTRVGFRPSQDTVNYFRSFDPYEDPNPPHTRQGGPTNPIRTFPPDSIYGLYSTRGNVWEWVQDVIPLSEIPELATGDLDQRLVYRRVLGGAWNTPLSGFGPRGLDVPQGRFPENHTSWSLGVRFVVSDPRPEVDSDDSDLAETTINGQLSE